MQGKVCYCRPNTCETNHMFTGLLFRENVLNLWWCSLNDYSWLQVLCVLQMRHNPINLAIQIAFLWATCSHKSRLWHTPNIMTAQWWCCNRVCPSSDEISNDTKRVSVKFAWTKCIGITEYLVSNFSYYISLTVNILLLKHMYDRNETAHTLSLAIAVTFASSWLMTRD